MVVEQHGGTVLLVTDPLHMSPALTCPSLPGQFPPSARVIEANSLLMPIVADRPEDDPLDSCPLPSCLCVTPSTEEQGGPVTCFYLV